MPLHIGGGAAAALLSAILMYAALPSASAMQGDGADVSGTSVLEAADHGELSAEIAVGGVSRIALVNDRIARVVRGSDGFTVEHDPARGDLYIRPFAGSGVLPEAGSATEPEASSAVLFVGTEKGFTYRLTLTPSDGGPAQILIRNPEAAGANRDLSSAGDPRIAALVRLVRAVARREPLAGYAIHPGDAFSGLTVIETWLGLRFSALVFEAGPSAPEGAKGAAGLAGTIGGLAGVGHTGDGARLAALWLAAPGTTPSGGRLAVAVVEDAPVADPRHAGDSR